MMLLRAVLFVAVASIVVAGCASVSGYDPNRYVGTKEEKGDADVDTAPLPPAPRPKIVDPVGARPSSAATP